VIQGAKRQDAERNVGAGKHAGHGTDAAVAAAHHHRIDLGCLRPGQCAFGEMLQVRARADFEVRRDVERLERGRQIATQAIRAPVARGACACIQEHNQPQAWLS
jgi:hypothetical protein